MFGEVAVTVPAKRKPGRPPKPKGESVPKAPKADKVKPFVALALDELNDKYPELPIGDRTSACVRLAKFAKGVKGHTAAADAVGLAADLLVEQLERQGGCGKLTPRQWFIARAEDCLDPKTYEHHNRAAVAPPAPLSFDEQKRLAREARYRADNLAALNRPSGPLPRVS